MSFICLCHVNLWYSHVDTKVSENLSDLLTKTKLCNDISNFSPVYQTSILDAFHSLMINFVPKSNAFSYKGKVGR